jgi:hypothetical protein
LLTCHLCPRLAAQASPAHAAWLVPALPARWSYFWKGGVTEGALLSGAAVAPAAAAVAWQQQQQQLAGGRRGAGRGQGEGEGDAAEGGEPGAGVIVDVLRGLGLGGAGGGEAAEEDDPIEA